jgi:hypothetical protein
MSNLGDHVVLASAWRTAKIPPPSWGRLGGGDCRTPEVRLPPTSNPSPRGGGGCVIALVAYFVIASPLPGGFRFRRASRPFP